ncbi:MAG TPA: FAD/NAD(P)-binding oxidoreductase [Anaerolineales bacterium]|nr:FAD/NAD(P)-binding oxidoreductase [Anaerolineales bacterium]
MSGKTILILGGGVGGLVAANELRRKLPREHRILLVEKNPRHAFAPSFLWLMTGDRCPEQISCDLRRLVRPGVELILAEVQAIDPNNRSVQTSDRTIQYDYLVIALGAELAPEIISGLEQEAHTFYSFEGAQKLRDTLRSFQGGRVAVVVSALPYKCPGAPHEGAMLIADSLRKQGLGDRAEVHLYTPEAQPMPVAGPVLGEAVKRMLEDKGVAFHPQHKLARVEHEKREVHFEGKDPVQYDLLVAIPPHRSPQVVRQAGLANPAGWIPVDRHSLLTELENVYALGDVTAISIPGRWKPDIALMLPKAGVFAHAQAEVVASRLAAQVTGETLQKNFPGIGYCMLEAGESLAGFAFGDFFAEPSPNIELRQIGKTWHLGKVLFEQWWLAPYGIRRAALQLALSLGARGFGIPVIL